MKRRLMRVFIWFLVVAVTVFLIRAMEHHIVPKKKKSTKEMDYNNIEVTRNKYHLRNFLWSGIFPIYGGFISDPHFLYSLPIDTTAYLLPVFQGKSIRHQLVQVNPFFKNETSEMLLAIEIDGIPYEYQLSNFGEYRALSSSSEPVSEFLFHENKLFYILMQGIGNDFLIYEISPPFDEDKVLSHHLVTIGQSEVPPYLNFPYSEDQIERLMNHQYSYFYNFYTQLLNKNYAKSQLDSQRGEALKLHTLYGANLNLDPVKLNKLIKQNEGLFGIQMRSDYEFISSDQVVDITYDSNDNIVIEVDHLNYYDVISAGDTFATSTYAIKHETKHILIESRYIERMMRYIDQYYNRRSEKSIEIEYLRDRIDGTYENVPFLTEIITEDQEELKIHRNSVSFVILPPYTQDQLLGNFSNKTAYAVPDRTLQSEYLFVIDFHGFSLKLTYDEVQKLALFLQEMLEE